MIFQKKTLRDYIDQHRTQSDHIPQKELLAIFRGICDGIDVLHAQTPPLAHRDIKVGRRIIVR